MRRQQRRKHQVPDRYNGQREPEEDQQLERDGWEAEREEARQRILAMMRRRNCRS